jgi:replicative DNA helicase
VWSLDDSLRYVPRVMTHVFSTGRREVFELRLASGKTVRATANHPFLTYDGWRPLGELEAGSRLAVPRHVPAPVGPVADAPVPARFPMSRDVFRSPKTTIACTLWGLWREHGGVDAGADGAGTLWLTCDSAGDTEDVSRLLLRFGISVVTRGCAVRIVDVDDQRRFLQEIGFPGEDAARMLRRVVADTKARRNGAARESQVWQRVERLLTKPVAPSGGMAAARTQTLERMTSVLAEDDLEMAATNDVLWDTVVAITSVGEEEVFDATVLNGHNFVADGVAVHNSIEQDADMVVLLHREELYERESPRAGEADFIVAKHRNGPTATITVAFQGHYSRFVDMAQS